MTKVSLKFPILIGIGYAALVITALSVIHWKEIEPATQVAFAIR